MPPIIDDAEVLAAPGVQSGLLMMALQVLQDRALLWATLLSAGGLWGYVAFHPDVMRLIIACTYSMLIAWPIIWLTRK